MRHELLGVAVGVVLGVGCSNSTPSYGGGTGGGTGGGPTCTPTATQVCMINTSFSPANLTVPVGTMVTWMNGDSVVHYVTSATGSPGTAYSSTSVAGGGTFSHTFGAAGTYPYYCTIHGHDGTPPTGMHGTITVQ